MQSTEKEYRSTRKISDSWVFPRTSSGYRLATGVAVTGNCDLVWAAANFGYIVGFVHGFSGKSKAILTGKYALGGFCLSSGYFLLHECLFGVLKRRYDYENFYITHTATSILCLPVFTALQYLVRRVSLTEARMMGYRYIGTLCCANLIFETLLSIGKYRCLSHGKTVNQPLTTLKDYISIREPRDTKS